MDYPRYGYLGMKEQCKEVPIAFPPQHQERVPALEWLMVPRPIFDNPNYRGSGKLAGKVALITGGDSGIGRAVGVAFAKEGASVAFAYLDEHRDAEETKRYIEGLGAPCLALAVDLRAEGAGRWLVEQVIQHDGRLDILVNNAAVAYPAQSIAETTAESLEDTFRTNVFACFFVVKAALPHLHPGSVILNTVSPVATEGLKERIDYAASKGAVLTFTLSLAKDLAARGIRVNGVSPGPVWTPLIVGGLPAEAVPLFGTGTLLERAAQPFEVAPAYVYLASDDARYLTGQILTVNAGATTGL